jgi:hypothetical protein
LAIAVLLGLETWSAPSYNTPVQQWKARQLALKGLWAERDTSPQSVLHVSGRRDEPPHVVDLDAMIFAQDHRIATVNGYSGYGPPGYLRLDRCASLATLLESYETVGGIRGLAQKLEQIRRSAVRLSLDPCPVRIVDEPARDVTREEVDALRLKLLGFKQLGNSIEFSVAITNSGSTIFNTQSGKGHPINLAWRIATRADVGDMTAGWHYRKWLGFSLAPGETQEIKASGPLSLQRGARFLQVTLVQENVAWLHDLGMPIASGEMTEVP